MNIHPSVIQYFRSRDAGRYLDPEVRGVGCQPERLRESYKLKNLHACLAMHLTA